MSLAEAEVASCAAARAKRDTMGSSASILLLILLDERVDDLFVSIHSSKDWGSHKGGYGSELNGATGAMIAFIHSNECLLERQVTHVQWVDVGRKMV
jgi:hypothetical protein